MHVNVAVIIITTIEAHHAKLQINSTIADIFVPKKMRRKERDVGQVGRESRYITCRLLY